jgi:hypothetical protein
MSRWRGRCVGEEYERLLPPTVYRKIDGEWGSLSSKLSGTKPGTGSYTAAPDQVNSAGFFDVLVGQQDRHLNNFMWDATLGRLGLFDHGFCFPGEGREHRIRTAALQGQRRYKRIELSSDEIDLVKRVLASGDLLGIAPLLEPERVARMAVRLENLLKRRPPVIPRRDVT